MSTPATSSGLPPDEPKWISGQDDEIRWGQSKSGNVPAGSRDEYADRAGLPRLPESANGVEYIHAAQDAAKQRWHPRGPTHGHSAISEFDPASPGIPPPGFRQTMAPISEPRVTVTSQPHPRRPATYWRPPKNPFGASRERPGQT
jgi:hypothetical protein